MRFFDEVSIFVQSGRWWDGCVSGRREMGVPFGWPAGGNGGDGGDIIFQADKNLNTLEKFRFNARYIAQEWEPGRSKDQYGADAEDLIIKVPVGTIFWNNQDWTMIQHLSQDGEVRKALKWWNGGVGNMHFKTATQQYPRFALLWEPWDSLNIRLELQLLADVWLIWAPSVGKSTIINTISSTKAKVAEYHFTTLVPNLGIVHQSDSNRWVIDIPWLVKWASEWKWLGNIFLRHILKCKIFALVVDMSRYEAWYTEIEDILSEIIIFINSKFDDYQDLQIKFEINHNWLLMNVLSKDQDGEVFVLAQKSIHIVLTKYDLVNDMEIANEYKDFVRDNFLNYLKKTHNLKFTKKMSDIFDSHIHIISCGNGFGLDIRKQYCSDIIKNLELKTQNYLENKKEIEKIQKKEREMRESTKQRKWYLIQNGFVNQDDRQHDTMVWTIISWEMSRLTNIVQRWNDQAESWFWKILDKQWILNKLNKQNVRYGDILHIVTNYKTVDDRFIIYKV